MTVDEVKARVAVLSKVTYETAREAERRIYEDVVRAIAGDCENPVALATAAIEAERYIETRWPATFDPFIFRLGPVGVGDE